MEESFFEGPEKKVEWVVAPGFPSLRSLGEDRWRQVVADSRARILSKISNDRCDAYLLSESSLFVFDDHALLITCGRTRLIDAVESILSFIPSDAIQLLIYERKNEHFPERQHSTFYEDAARLQKLLPGRAYRFGDEDEHRVQIFHTERPFTPDPTDTTLEILMHGISDQALQRFAQHRVGFSNLLQGFLIDEHLFTPKGYSLNALNGGCYYTLHVTPERIGSYVSFETNYDVRAEPLALVRKVLEWFEPKSFDLVSFLPQGTLDFEIPGYRVRDRVQRRLSCGYLVTFVYYYSPLSGPRPPFELTFE